MSAAVEVTITGRVQGVMFRDSARRKAASLGLVGIVQNKEDGSVFLCAEGEKKGLDELAAYLRKGPMLARVDDIKVKEVEANGRYTDFSIVYD